MGRYCVVIGSLLGRCWVVSRPGLATAPESNSDRKLNCQLDLPGMRFAGLGWVRVSWACRSDQRGTKPRKPSPHGATCRERHRNIDVNFPPKKHKKIKGTDGPFAPFVLYPLLRLHRSKIEHPKTLRLAVNAQTGIRPHSQPGHGGIRPHSQPGHGGTSRVQYRLDASTIKN